jgi:eukaryotic-like serine/threonine-protein kinase
LLPHLKVQANSGVSVKPGDMLDGRYMLRDCIAQGGMGRVYLAEQPALERIVAIKLLQPELAPRPEYARCIRDEAIAASRVRDPRCVKVFDCGSLPDGTPYLVMEHIPGRSLRDLVAEEPVPAARAIELLDHVLGALGAVHDAGIVHADVKSDNFLVESVDGADRVTMIDFGLARVAGSPFCLDDEHGDPMVLGTPEYMAPEVVRGKPPTQASDLYSAGVILYELLTGTVPFTGNTAGHIMLQQLHGFVIAPSRRRPDRGIPPALDRIVLRALDKRADARFADAAAFARELRSSVRRMRTTSIERPHPPVRATGSSPAIAPPDDARARLALGRVAHGSDCGGGHRPDADPPEPRILIAAPVDGLQERGSSSLKIVRKATMSEMSCSDKPR